jgi:lysyl-tRNA synthetase class 2
VAEKKVELNENEKVVFDILSKNSPIELGELKTQSGLSNKQWDKSIKGLTKAGIAKVGKTDDGLMVEVVD